MTEASNGFIPFAKVGVAVPAAGSGQRMGGTRKAFLELLDEPMLVHAIRPFLAEARVVSVVVALSDKDISALPSWSESIDSRVMFVPGGNTRSQSVRAAIEALPAEIDVIAVHDGARPLVRSSVVSRCIDLAADGFGAIAGTPAVDTIKHVSEEKIVLKTPDRGLLWHAHTPQVFPAGLLRRAYSDMGAEGSDDGALVESLHSNLEIKMVDAGRFNLKVTHGSDLVLAEAILTSLSDSR